MSEDIKVEDNHDVEQIQETETLVDETQVESNEEIVDVEEAKAKPTSEDEDKAEVEVDGDEDEEDDEEDDKSESEAPVVEMPKTKAGIVSAAYDMLKKSKKEDAQKIFASMLKVVEGVEVVDGEEVVAEAAVKAEADVAHIDYQEDLDAMVAEEATLSDGFRDKAGIIFEAALKTKVSEEVDRLEVEYAQNLEEEVTSLKSDLVEKVDAYLSYVVEGWMKDNELAVETGLRSEIAEEFMTSLQGVFKEHYIEIPESKVDMFDELSGQVTELEEQLNKTTEENIALHEATQAFARVDIVRNQSSDLASTEAEKLASLVEDLDFTDAESFEMKVKTIKESYFAKETVETVSEVTELIGSDHAAEQDISDSMTRYMQAIAKSNK
jgi:hypothetical protein